MSKIRLFLNAERLKAEPHGLVYKLLIEKLDIDEDYYDINIGKVKIVDDIHTLDKHADVEYELIRCAWWNDLEECEERLRIGV